MDAEPQELANTPSESDFKPTIRENFEYSPDIAQQMGKLAGVSYFDMGKFGTKTVSVGPGDYKIEKSRVIKKSPDGSQLLITYQTIDKPHEYVRFLKKGVKSSAVAVPGRLKTTELIIEPYPLVPFHRDDPKKGTDFRKFITYSLKTFKGGTHWTENYEGRYHRNESETQAAQSFIETALNSETDTQATEKLYKDEWVKKRYKQDHIERGTSSADRFVSDSFPPGKGGLPTNRL